MRTLVVTTMPTSEVAAARVKPRRRLRRGPDGVRELADDIACNGIRVPLLLHRRRDGSLLLADGNHRLAAAEDLGLGEVPVQVREG